MAKYRSQVAAIPMRWTDDGNLRILMVTSRDTGRWVLPKGWTMDGKTDWKAAEIEALEEAGVKGYISEEELGTYTYEKDLGRGKTVTCRVQLYPMIVDQVKRNWKERRERKRHWFSAKGAARAVDEPDLRRVLENLSVKPRKQPIIRRLLKAS